MPPSRCCHRMCREAAVSTFIGRTQTVRRNTDPLFFKMTPSFSAMRPIFVRMPSCRFCSPGFVNGAASQARHDRGRRGRTASISPGPLKKPPTTCQSPGHQDPHNTIVFFNSIAPTWNRSEDTRYAEPSCFCIGEVEMGHENGQYAPPDDYDLRPRPVCVLTQTHIVTIL
ncbi:hypothetical protein BDR05DRAFT_497508 [Suillus weaverae]|nr:hypothetical protein BDR05DRAFT_497508 [Suillus weaverae]